MKRMIATVLALLFISIVSEYLCGDEMRLIDFLMCSFIISLTIDS